MTEKSGPSKFVIFIAFAGIITSILFQPPIFYSIFSMSNGEGQSNIALYLFNIILLIISIALLMVNFSLKKEFALVFLILLIPLWAELASRLYITQVKPELKENYLRLAYMTDPETQRFKAHPFLHYVGNPSRRGKVSPRDVSYNKYGFRGPDWTYEKPENVIRVACLGGSTTHSGYPEELERFLNKENVNKDVSFEVMNFGIDGYTTAHSMVNYSLNVRHFDPDVLIIHHGWNEVNVRGVSKDFYYDYSQVFKVYNSPEIYDAFLWRGSVLYRYLMSKLNIQPYWLDLLNVIRKPWDDNLNNNYDNLEELVPYRRNIEAIINLALSDNAKVILTTLPRSYDSNKRFYISARNIDQCNEIDREIYAEFGDKINFLDLDKKFSGTPELEVHFNDLAHLDEDGLSIKALELAHMILGGVN